MTWYNEFDRHAAAWLRELIAQGQLPEGVVDERSIEDLQPEDCATTSHFFAGIGGWPYALRLAGWPAGRPVWTGSCPCQPFSGAGKRKGHEDARHLWPAWFRLIRECRPPTIFGEQVASADGRPWLAAVRADLETLGYAVGAADLCAAGVGAPHIRQRLFWVVDCYSTSERQNTGRMGTGQRKEKTGEPKLGGIGEISWDGRPADGLADAASQRGCGEAKAGGCLEFRGSSGHDGLGDTDRAGQREHGGAVAVQPRHSAAQLRGNARHWDACEHIPCSDGTARPTQPGIRPLAHGISGRVGLLRGYGNAIVPQVAAEFIKAYMTLCAGAEEK